MVLPVLTQRILQLETLSQARTTNAPLLPRTKTTTQHWQTRRLSSAYPRMGGCDSLPRWSLLHKQRAIGRNPLRHAVFSCFLQEKYSKSHHRIQAHASAGEIYPDLVS